MKFGVFSEKGAIIPVVYDYIEKIHLEDYFFAKKGDNISLIDLLGNDYSDEQKNENIERENGWIRKRNNGKWGWVDRLGNVKIPFVYDAITPFVNGYSRVIRSPYWESYLINTNGEFIIGY